MNKQEILEKAKTFVSDALGSDSSGHDYWHAIRVAKMAVKIAKVESADVFLCELAGLLHDIADEKLNESKEMGLNKVRSFLEHQNVEKAAIDRVMEMIDTMSFSGGGGLPMKTLEGAIVQDADRLDAIGAIGMARTFAFSGSKGQLIYDPLIKPRAHITRENYRSEKSTAINHFYEKLLKLKGLMNTSYAKEIAEKRHQYMVTFLDQFFMEWDVK